LAQSCCNITSVLALVGKQGATRSMTRPWASSYVSFCALVVMPCTADTEFEFQRVRNYTGLDHAGYAFLSDLLPGSLLLNRFGAAPFFGKSQVSLVNLTSGKVKDVATNIDWPNVATIVDEKVFGFRAALIGSGFLVPSHTVGGIWLLELADEPQVLKKGPVKLTADLKTWKPDSGWFYHKGDLIDMNGDGLLDIVTARCAYSVEPWNPKSGKLVWLEHPASLAFDGKPWTEHVMQDGPDFLFTIAPENVSGAEFGACAAEFIGERLTYVHGSEKNGYSTRVLDADLGPGFGCLWVDLNGDGKLDLLATNHLNQGGSVFAYTWDGDLADNSSTVHKHVLATGFNAASTSQGQAAPGDAIPFFVSATNTDGKPLILVSADNGNYICFLLPNAPNDPADWTYTKKIIDFIGADVGRPAIADTDGDGYNDIFVPAYDSGQVVQYKIKIQDTAPVVV